VISAIGSSWKQPQRSRLVSCSARVALRFLSSVNQRVRCGKSKAAFVEALSSDAPVKEQPRVEGLEFQACLYLPYLIHNGLLHIQTTTTIIAYHCALLHRHDDRLRSIPVATAATPSSLALRNAHNELDAARLLHRRSLSAESSFKWEAWPPLLLNWHCLRDTVPTTRHVGPSNRPAVRSTYAPSLWSAFATTVQLGTIDATPETTRSYIPLTITIATTWYQKPIAALGSIRGGRCERPSKCAGAVQIRDR
jgi:hypothetical protein